MPRAYTREPTRPDAESEQTHDNCEWLNEEDREQDMDDRDDLEHAVRIACGREGAWLATARRFAPPM